MFVFIIVTIISITNNISCDSSWNSYPPVRAFPPRTSVKPPYVPFQVRATWYIIFVFQHFLLSKIGNGADQFFDNDNYHSILFISKLFYYIIWQSNTTNTDTFQWRGVPEPESFSPAGASLSSLSLH